MLISPINTANYRKNNQLQYSKTRCQSISAPSNYYSTYFYADYGNIGLKNQRLHKSSNLISFQKLAVKGLFKTVGAFESNPLWEKFIARAKISPVKPNDFRSEFIIDYDRITHSGEYNKLGDKTQVFSHPTSSTTSKRIHHVNQVASIAENIAGFLGLNTELTRAIAIGHDLGHTPFGHAGEVILSNIMKFLGFIDSFWHGKHSLRILDDIATKLDFQGNHSNLNLTYAVRDGVISHSGKIEKNGLMPRSEYINLPEITKNNRHNPFTWEGCVVRISDDIAYLGKDLEDAINNKFLDPKKINELRKKIKHETGLKFDEINNTVLINHFVNDLCSNSSPEKGLRFSNPTFKLMHIVKNFNYENIYHPKDAIQGPYYDLAINTIFNTIDKYYKGQDTLLELKKLRETKPALANSFSNWLIKYSNISPLKKAKGKYQNKNLYDINNPQDYKLSIIEYIASLTDTDAKNIFEEIIFFG